MAAIRATRRNGPLSRRAAFPSRSSNARTNKSRASSSCRKDGSSKEHWGGSIARDACRRISRRQSNPRSHGCNWPLLSSSCEGSQERKSAPLEFRVGLSSKSDIASRKQIQRAPEEQEARLRIPTKPAMHSNLKPATYTDLKPATVPI